MLSEKIIPSIPVPEQKQSETVVQPAVLMNTQQEEVAVTKNIEINETVSENLFTEADAETVKNTSNEPEKKRIPVLPIAAVAVTFAAGAGIMIPKKKKK